MPENRKLRESLSSLQGRRTLILGIGNMLKADDGAGPLLCRQIKGKLTADVIDAGTVPENYIQPIVEKNPEALLIIDAIDFAAAPGTIKVFKPKDLTSLSVSTHAPSPQLFVDMITQQIDVDVYFIGIQPAQLTLAAAPSNEVDRTIKTIAEVLVELFGPPPQFRD